MRVLIAEDDAVSRLILRKSIAKLGHECAVAEDGDRAWELCSSQPVDVVISDWMMPGLDGPELCRRIRQADGDGYIYVILLTSLDDKQHLLDGLQAGADDYLTKPLAVEELQVRLIAAERVTSLHKTLAEKTVQLERANNRLFEEGRTDALTRLRNRMAMQEDITKLHDQCRRYGHRYAVALLDIDFYKRYNDRYGHLEGDQVLVRVAAALAASCRAADSVYRYGGEEFLVLLPEQDRAGATLALERLRLAVRDLAIEHLDHPKQRVTISSGIAILNVDEPKELDALLREADQALYFAKENGRDCIGVFQDGICEPVAH
jgi:two-component system cell cycle response regulator